MIAFLAVLALVFGQSAAGLHALKHLGSRSDVSGGPAQHVQICLECASFAPLSGAHGGAVHVLIVVPVATSLWLAPTHVAPVVARDTRPFQARAPPR